MSKDKREINLDRILIEEVGQWGRFQLKAMVLCAFMVMMGGLPGFAYLFTIAKVKTRCAIPECENNSAGFSPPWLLDAVPLSGDSFDNCHRYPAIRISPNSSDSCSANLFDKNKTVSCEEYVYEQNNSAYFEFNLACDDWKPTLIGSARLIGMMICLPFVGFVGDRWGRRLAVSITMFNVAWIGTLGYFANSYTSYITISFAENLFGSFFASAYILALELVGPKYRVRAGATISTCLGIGETILGLIAWTEPHWRNLILILYLPQFIFLTYFWIAPESVRWLLSKGRHQEALAILKKGAEINGNALSEKTIKEFSDVKDTEKEKDTVEPWLVCLVFRHKPILLRCIVTPVWWITATLMYYGLTISSVGLSGNKYLNYTASVAFQTPGYWLAVVLLDRIGRKAVLMTGFLISGICQFAFIFTSNDYYWFSLFIITAYRRPLLDTGLPRGPPPLSMCISGVMTSLYVYTAELYPTRYRTSLLGYSSMIGRIGSIVAPLTPGLAAKVWVELPFLLFGVMALASALLVLLAPETLGAALPDSMEEAAALGRGEESSVKRWLRGLVFKSKSYTIR